MQKIPHISRIFYRWIVPYAGPVSLCARQRRHFLSPQPAFPPQAIPIICAVQDFHKWKQKKESHNREQHPISSERQIVEGTVCMCVFDLVSVFSPQLDVKLCRQQACIVFAFLAIPVGSSVSVCTCSAVARCTTAVCTRYPNVVCMYII